MGALMTAIEKTIDRLTERAIETTIERATPCRR